MLHLIAASFLRELRLPFGLWRGVDVSIGRDIGVRGTIHLDAISIGDDSLCFPVHLLPDGCISVIGSDVGLLSVGHFNDIILIKWIIC